MIFVREVSFGIIAIDLAHRGLLGGLTGLGGIAMTVWSQLRGGNKDAQRAIFQPVMFVTFLVGARRVVLGVHYPSDVIAGWLLGMTWALLCWLVERTLERGAGLKREQLEHQSSS